jgi:hypothetical protein
LKLQQEVVANEERSRQLREVRISSGVVVSFGEFHFVFRITNCFSVLCDLLVVTTCESEWWVTANSGGD